MVLIKKNSVSMWTHGLNSCCSRVTYILQLLEKIVDGQQNGNFRREMVEKFERMRHSFRSDIGQRRRSMLSPKDTAEPSTLSDVYFRKLKFY